MGCLQTQEDDDCDNLLFRTLHSDAASLTIEEMYERWLAGDKSIGVHAEDEEGEEDEWSIVDDSDFEEVSPPNDDDDEEMAS